MTRRGNRFGSIGCFVALLMLAMVLPAHAIGSSSADKPEQTAADREKEAVAVYNKGVEQMAKAKSIAAAGDSTFAFNYRATSDAKARKQYEKAVDSFRDALRLKPSMKEAHNNLGYVYRKLGKLRESLTAYRAALASDSLFAQAREYLGETFLALNHLDSAVAQHSWLVQASSPYADSLQLAIDLYRLQQLNEKIKSDK